MTVSAERLALTSLQELNALKCNKMEHLEGVLNKFEQLRGRCGPMAPLHSFEYLRKIVKNISQCHFVLNQVQHAPPSAEKAEVLLADLRRVIAEWKFERTFHEKGDGGAAAAAASFGMGCVGTSTSAGGGSPSFEPLPPAVEYAFSIMPTSTEPAAPSMPD